MASYCLISQGSAARPDGRGFDVSPGVHADIEGEAKTRVCSNHHQERSRHGGISHEGTFGDCKHSVEVFVKVCVSQLLPQFSSQQIDFVMICLISCGKAGIWDKLISISDNFGLI